VAVVIEHDPHGDPPLAKRFRRRGGADADPLLQFFGCLGLQSKDNFASGQLFFKLGGGFVVTVTDEAGKKRQIQTDALGRITQVTEDPGGLGYGTTYGYSGLTTSVTSGSNQRTYVHDELGRLTSETNPESGTVGYVYNSSGDLSTRTDARGIVTTYGFDLLHRITGKTYSDGTPQVVYGYDISNPFYQTATNTVGRLVQIWTGSNPQFATWTAFSYDSMGRATTQWNCLSFPWANPCQNIVATKMQYDLAGNLTQMTYPSGMVVQQSYDSAGRLCQVAGATSNCSTATNPWATAFSYNPASQATAFNYGNGVAATFGYSNRLQRNSLKYAKGGTTLFNLNYAFGSAGSNNGNISAITDTVDNGRSVTYGYDPLNRLSSALTTGSTNYPQWGLSWIYDRYGNRTTQTVTAGTSAPGLPTITINPTTNRITTSPYAFDASGNMTNDGNNTLGYDGESRVINASNGGGSGSYNYGGDGLRAHQVSGTAAINSIYSGSSVIGQYDNQSGVLGEFVYAGGQQLAQTGGASVSNGSFEQGLSGWTTQGSTVQVITDSSRAHSGSKYVQMSTSSVTASVTAPTFAVVPGDVVDFGGWVYLESGGGAAVDWVLYAFDSSHSLVAAVVPTPWSVTTPGAWTYETGSYTVPSNIAYVCLLAQVYQPSGATTVRFDDGFLVTGTRYFHPDHLSTRVLTSFNGSILGQQGHYPFGESWYAQNSTTNWQFTSYQRDTESQNDYSVMRSYVNRLARFSSPDPAGLAAADPSNPQSWNRYAYVLNNPLGLIDPSGLDDCVDAHEDCNSDFFQGGSPGFDILGGNIGNVIDLTSLPGATISVTVIGFLNDTFNLGDLLNGSWGSSTGGGNTSGGGAGNRGPSFFDKFAACTEANRLDNALRGLGQAYGHPDLGNAAANLTNTATGAAIANQALNLTASALIPVAFRGGVYSGFHSTSWPHFVGGLLSQATGESAFSAIGKVAGRALSAAAAVTIVAEGAYNGAAMARCGVVTALGNP
jgi:RHS repeat-associated protein